MYLKIRSQSAYFVNIAVSYPCMILKRQLFNSRGEDGSNRVLCDDFLVHPFVVLVFFVLLRNVINYVIELLHFPSIEVFKLFSQHCMLRVDGRVPKTLLVHFLNLHSILSLLFRLSGDTEWLSWQLLRIYEIEKNFEQTEESGIQTLLCSVEFQVEISSLRDRHLIEALCFKRKMFQSGRRYLQGARVCLVVELVWKSRKRSSKAK